MDGVAQLFRKASLTLVHQVEHTSSVSQARRVLQVALSECDAQLFPSMGGRYNKSSILFLEIDQLGVLYGC